MYLRGKSVLFTPTNELRHVLHKELGNLQKNLQNRNILTHIENKRMVTEKEWEDG